MFFGHGVQFFEASKILEGLVEQRASTI